VEKKRIVLMAVAAGLLLIGGSLYSARDTFAELVHRQAAADFRAQRWTSCIRKYNIAILLDSRREAFFCNRAGAYYNLGRYDKAVRDLSTALAINPNDKVASRLCAEAYRLSQNSPQESGQNSVEKLCDILKSDNPQLKRQAAYLLGGLGPAAQSAVPDLLNALKDHDYNVRRYAAYTLIKLGAQNKQIARAMAEGLSDNNVEQRRACAYGLAQIAPMAYDEQAVLSQALQDTDDQVRKYASYTLSILKNADYTTETLAKMDASRVLQYVDVPSPEIRHNAISALREIGLKKEYIPVLVKALDDPDAAVGQEAARALEELGPLAEEAIPALKRNMGNCRYREVCPAVLALGKIGQPALPALLEALEHENAFVRAAAARALREPLWEKAKDAIPALLMTANDSNSLVRNNATVALGKIFPENHIPVLVYALQDRDDDVRYSAAQALARPGLELKKYIPALIADLKNRNPLSIGIAGSTLIELLGTLGPDAKDALPVLTDILKNARLDNYSTRVKALHAIMQIGSPSKETIAALKEAAIDYSCEVRSAATEALNKFGETVPKATEDCVTESDDACI